MKGLNWGLCSSFSWTNDDNRHVLIAEEPCHFGISCQTTNFDDRYKYSIFSVFEFEINFEDFQAWYNRTQEYFLWTVASKYPIRVNLVIRSPSAFISLQVHSAQWFTERISFTLKLIHLYIYPYQTYPRLFMSLYQSLFSLISCNCSTEL